MEYLISIIEKLMEVAPWLAVVVFVIGSLRIVMKPLMSFAKAVASQTASTKDDLILSQVEESKVYKAIVYIVDWAASVKLPVKK